MLSQVGGLGAGRVGLIGPQPDLVVDRAPLAMELGGERGVPEVCARPRRGPRVGGPATDRAVIGVPGHAVGAEGDDEVGLDVGDEARDRVGAVALFAAAVFVAEQMELVDVEGGEAVAQLDRGAARRAGAAATSSGRSYRVRRVSP